MHMDDLKDKSGHIVVAPRGAAPGTGAGATPPTTRPPIGDALIAALSSGHDIVVLGSPSGRAVAELLAAIVPRLHKAGFATASITAPLSLSVLHDAIREALTEPAAASERTRPLVVAIEHAENLLLPTMRRLVELAALRRGGSPVLRFLLCGTPSLWTALRGAGLGALEHDESAHIRLPATAASGLPAIKLRHLRTPPSHRQPQARPGWRDASRGRRGALALVALTLSALTVTAIGSIAWVAVRPAPKLAAPPPPPAADDRLVFLLQREAAERAAGRMSSPPGDNVMETRGWIAALIPSLSPQGLRRLAAADAPPARAEPHAAVPASPGPAAAPPEGSSPTNDAIHVTVRYADGDADAAVRAARILERLHSQDVLADGPIPTAASDTQPRTPAISYGFAQDRQAAEALAERLLPGLGVPRLLAWSDGSLSRPGEVSLFIRSSGALAGAVPGERTPPPASTGSQP